MIASAIEGPIDKSGWRSDPKTLRAWLTVLDSLGYNLTAIEKVIQKGKIDTYTAD